MQRLGPLGHAGQDLRAADQDLEPEQDGRADRQPDERPPVALGAPGDDGDGQDDQPDDGGDPAVQDVGAGHVGHRRDQRAAHQRPVGEDQGASRWR